MFWTYFKGLHFLDHNVNIQSYPVLITVETVAGHTSLDLSNVRHVPWVPAHTFTQPRSLSGSPPPKGGVVTAPNQVSEPTRRMTGQGCDFCSTCYVCHPQQRFKSSS